LRSEKISEFFTIKFLSIGPPLNDDNQVRNQKLSTGGGAFY